MKWLLTSALALLGTAWAGVSLQWDNAQVIENQAITGTEVLINGQAVGETAGDTFEVDLSPFAAGETLSFTVRHVGTVNGEPATSQESDAVSYTVAPALSPPVNVRIEIIVSLPN